MDLHFTSDEPTLEERAAVDKLLGPPTSSHRGGSRDTNASRSDDATESRTHRHLLLPALHAVQGAIGWISPGALNYVCRRLTVPPAEAYGVATFYALFSTTPQPPTVVHVCDDIACKARGADDLCAELEQQFGPAGATPPGGCSAWKRSPCLGLCEHAPAALVQVASTEYQDSTLAPTNASDILALLNGGSAEPRSLGRSAPQSSSDAGPLLCRIGRTNPSSLAAYQAAGGYAALRRAVELGPAEVIAQVSASKLTGRGGAAFPTGVKWKAVLEAAAQPHYVVCNADESEPGTFKDRVLMEDDPFAVIEALTIAGFACAASRGYIYIRGEYPEATRALQNAIDQAKGAGLLGDNILSSGYSYEIEIRRGAGAYICGEETALLNSIEGKRGEPRNKPPFPVHVGLFGKPTAINNVETLLNVLEIVRAGGEAYADIGTANSTGTRLFCLSGCVQTPGVYEVPYGATLREVINLAGGVRNGRPLQAVLLGGAAGVFVRPDELDMPLTIEGARAANATLGSGVVMLFDDTVDLKPILLRIAAFFRDESCGQCVPCRVGTVRQEEALHRLIYAGTDAEAELNLLAELELVMKDASICGLGHTAASAIQSAVHRLELFGSRQSA